MSYSVQDAMAEVTGMLHGTTLNSVVNLEGVFNRTARQIILDLDPVETIRIAALATPIYPGTNDYVPPADLKKDKIVYLFPQSELQQRLAFGQTYNKTFDLWKNGRLNNFTVLQHDATTTLRVTNFDNSRAIQLEACNSVTGNGTWVAGGTASGLTVNTNFVPQELQYNLTAGVGTLTNSTMSAVDLSTHLNQSALFFDISVPTGATLTSVTIRWGSSASNYWEVSGITTNSVGGAFVNGNNTLKALWPNATTVGNPSASAVNYVQVRLTVSGSLTACLLGPITSKLGWPANIEYYSKYLFRSNTTGIWQETTTDPSDLINLDTDSYNIFVSLLFLKIVQQTFGADAGYDTNMMLTDYNNAVARYKSMYKSQLTPPQVPYYNRSFQNYNGLLGQNYFNR